MAHVCTLIADPATTPLNADLVDTARRVLGATEAPVWLAPGVACDLPLADLPTERAALEALPMDAVFQPAAGRRKKLLVADMESTMIANEMVDELADWLDLRPRIAGITERAMRGELDFAGSLRERVALLAGLATGTLDQAAERIRDNPGGARLVATMAAHGARCALVSGGFTFFAEPVGRRLGFHEVHANVLEIADGKLTGSVGEPILDAETKKRILLDLCARGGHDAAAAVAVGDGANDLPMLLTAGLGVAYHAKPKVAATARAAIRHGDLSALLYLQGYHREEFVTPA